MKNRRVRSIVITAFLAIVLDIAICSGANASGFVGSDTAKKIETKSYWHSLYTCYSLKNGGSKDYYKKSSRRYNANGTDFKNDSSAGWGQIDSEIEMDEYYADKWGFSFRKLFPNHNAKNAVYLPNGLTPAGDDSSNCAHVINGDAWDGGDGFKDTFYDRVGKSSVKFEKNSDSTAVSNFMSGMGYTRDAGVGTTKCIKFSFHWKKERIGDSGASQDDGDGTSSSACFDISDGISLISYEGSGEYSGYLQLYFSDDSGFSIFVRPTESTKTPNDYECEGMCNPQWVYSDYDSNRSYIELYDRSWDDFVDELKNTWAPAIANTSARGCESFTESSGMLWWYDEAECNDPFALSINNPQLVITDGESADVVWKINSDRDAAAQAAFSYLGGTSRTAQKLTDSQRVVLYQYYLADLGGAVVKCDVTDPDSSYIAIKWFNNATTRKDCYITVHAVNNNEYNIAPDGYFGKPVSFDDVVSELNGISISKLTDVDGAIVDSESTQEQNENRQTEEKEAEPDCYSNSGSLGWILCPIIEGGGKAIVSIYDTYITPFLVLDAGLFKSGDGTTYSAWSQFQGYANMAFIIVFLIVIFSQLTGYGLDNYGIKKILPKLIIAAVLINLSYIICQVAIDIANIIGYSVKGIFDGVGKVNMSELTIAEAPGAKNAFTASAILVVLVGLLVTPAILSNGWGILVPVFLAIIGIAIGIISLFVILAIRKALAIVLVVISPLAFVAYMLPNTKKIFDRWFTSFKATLLAFPICSAMVFGGQAVARIMLSVAGTTKLPSAMALSAAAMSIAPVFLIPSVLKKSMGAISGMIDRVSHGVNRHARGRVAGSGIAHDLQRRGQMQRAGVKVGKDGKVQLTRRGRIQNALPRTAASRQRLDAIRADAVKSMGATAAAGSYMGDKGLDKMNAIYSSAQAAQSKQRVSDLEAMINTGDEANNISALQRHLTEAINSGDVDAVKAYQNVLTSKGEAGREAVRDAMIASGDKASKAGIQAYSQNIMENHQAAYKAKNRSVYDFAKAGQESGAATMSNSINTAKLTGDQMAGMDDKAFERLQQQPVDDNMRAAAYAALNSEGINSMEQGRRTALEQMAAGYQPAGSTSGAVDSAQDAGSTPPEPTTESISTPSSPSTAASGTDWASMTDEQKKFLQRSNPRQEGESTADWAARIQRETGFTIGKQAPKSDWSTMSDEQKKYIHKTVPRQEGESTADYAARIQRETGFTIGKQPKA